jgi:hypothetical protein
LLYIKAAEIYRGVLLSRAYILFSHHHHQHAQSGDGVISNYEDDRLQTTAMFNCYNTVNLGDAQEAYRKLQEFLEQEEQPVNPGSGQKIAPIVLPE